MKKITIPAKSLTLFAGILFMALQLPAQTWVGTTSDWNVASNWNPAQIPGPNSVVTIPDATFNPIVKAGTMATAKKITIEPNAALTINENATLNINGASNHCIDNDGALYVLGTVNMSGSTEYALRNNKTVSVQKTGVINIDGSFSGIVNTYLGSFSNKGTILIGQQSGMTYSGLVNTGDFINDHGTIKIDRITDNAIEIEGSAKLYSSGVIELGSIAPIGDRGILLEYGGVFELNGFGQSLLTINRFSKYGIQSEDELKNNGTIKIGNISGGQYGIYNKSNFFNQSNGKIYIDGCSEAALFADNYGIWENNNEIILGSASSPGKYGILNGGQFFKNMPGGTITISRTTEAAIFNLNSNATGTFMNRGKVLVGVEGTTGGAGIRNMGAFNNQLGASVIIQQTTILGVMNEGNMSNQSTWLVFSQQANANYKSFYNAAGGVFENYYAGNLFLWGPIINLGTVLQKGLLVLTSTTPSSNPTSTFVNDGIISTSIANSIPNVINHDLIIGPLTGNCNIANSVLTTGSENTFIVPTIWHMEEDFTNVAGVFNGGANTFTMQASNSPAVVFAKVSSAEFAFSTITVPIFSNLKDNTPPSVTCKPYTLQLNNNGNATLAANDILGIMGDNCVSVSVKSISKSNFTCSETGTHSVMLTVQDGSGNTANCQSTVTVKDVSVPTLTCNATHNVFLNASGTATLNPSNMIASISDNCGATLQPLANTTFSCAQIGGQIIVLTAKDASGNTSTCAVKVNIIDGIAPSLQCKSVNLTLNANGQATLLLSQVMNSVSDNCQVVSTTLSQSSFNCAHTGTNTVKVQAFDAYGNIAECNVPVNVTDLIAPVAQCKNTLINLGANGSTGPMGALVNNGSSDNCTFTFSTIPAQLTCANIGTNTVTLRVTDASGNTATCVSQVQVKDATPPTMLCKNPIIYLDDEGQATLSVALVNNGSTDACGMASLVLSKTTFNCSELQGTTWPVLLTGRDIHNNTATCQATVTIKDALAPTAICQNTTVELGSNGSVVVNTSALAEESFDNCAVWSYSPAVKVYTAANLGNNNLTITVKDWSGNGTPCTAVVTVVPFGGLQGGSEERAETVVHPTDAPLFPNPATDQVTIEWYMSTGQSAQLTMVDMNGKIVSNKQLECQPGTNTLQWALTGIPAGIYSVVLKTGEKNNQWRLVVVRD